MSDERMVGSRIGDFEILAAIGAGGMGSVFKARSVTLDRLVAIKILSVKLSGDRSFVERFLKEARSVARLNHPGIVQIYDFGEADSVFYLVMEYIDGQSVAQMLRGHGTIPAAQSIGLIRQASLALATAHEAGIVHRDVKPENLMLTRTARIKLIDLGLARLVDEDVSMTMTGVTMGTPLYIAPEQIHGKVPVDARADIYSLGATLFHMVTGHPPFPAANGMNVMARHLVDPVPDPRSHVPGLSAGLCRVIGTMMAKAPADRFGDMMSVERELAALAAEPSFEASEADACTVVLGGTFEASRGSSAPSPSGSMSPASSGGAPSGWDSAVLRAIEEQLAAEIGPLAKVLVRRTAREVTSLEALCRKLGEQDLGGQRTRSLPPQLLEADSILVRRIQPARKNELHARRIRSARGSGPCSRRRDSWRSAARFTPGRGRPVTVAGLERLRHQGHRGGAERPYRAVGETAGQERGEARQQPGRTDLVPGRTDR